MSNPTAVAVRDARRDSRSSAACPTLEDGDRVALLSHDALDGVVRRRSERARPQLLDRGRSSAPSSASCRPGLRLPERGDARSGSRSRSLAPSRRSGADQARASSGCRSWRAFEARRGPRRADRTARSDREPPAREVRRLPDVRARSSRGSLRESCRSRRSCSGRSRGRCGSCSAQSAILLADRLRQRRESFSGSHRAAARATSRSAARSALPRWNLDPAAARSRRSIVAIARRRARRRRGRSARCR